MHQELLERLRSITEEERAILDGRTTIDRDIYMQDRSNIVNAKKLLASGKLITVRPHTRFIHFPEHTHDYVEVVYMCAGQTTHIVNGKEIVLEEGARWFAQPGHRYMDLATCPEHGKFLIRVKLSDQQDNTVRVSRLTYEATSEAAEAYARRAEKADPENISHSPSRRRRRRSRLPQKENQE